VSVRSLRTIVQFLYVIRAGGQKGLGVGAVGVGATDLSLILRHDFGCLTRCEECFLSAVTSWCRCVAGGGAFQATRSPMETDYVMSSRDKAASLLHSLGFRAYPLLYETEYDN
jgi:hypothetical protein